LENPAYAFRQNQEEHSIANLARQSRHPEGAANAVAFLASAGASYNTGQVLCVAGGMVM
jgi:NAD(P)-dependent dehydrogenase (short-subunit alcohol dehydrogenase family)